MNRKRLPPYVAYAVILFLLAAVPLITREPYVFHILCLIGINVIFACSLNAIINIGELNLAQAAFMGIGAYTSTLLVTRLGLSFWIAIPIEVARQAKLLWLNYPNNPTGAVASLEFFAEAVAFARQHDLLLCHDAPYCDIAYEGYRPPSLLQVGGAKEVTIEFNSFSKTYNMAGWRIGMVVGNRAAIKALAQVKTNVDSGIFTAIQEAAVEALTGDQTWLESRNAIYQERRDIILEGLAAVGIKARKPLATLYIWAEVPEGYSSAEFADKLLTEQGVSLTPGSAYGEYGEGYLRASVGMATWRVREAMERLKEFEF